MKKWAEVVFIVFLLASISYGIEDVKGVNLEIHNPYRHSFSLEFKCDRSTGGKYAFYQTVEVEGKKITNFKLPNNLHNCEIWPKVSIF
jgi:hypothetical protein